MTKAYSLDDSSLRQSHTERGATFVEYVLLVVIVGVGIIGALTAFSGDTETTLSGASQTLSTQISGAN